ncbi:unnamed protein product [Sphagnum jensenii]
MKAKVLLPARKTTLPTAIQVLSYHLPTATLPLLAERYLPKWANTSTTFTSFVRKALANQSAAPFPPFRKTASAPNTPPTSKRNIPLPTVWLKSSPNSATKKAHPNLSKPSPREEQQTQTSLRLR